MHDRMTYFCDYSWKEIGVMGYNDNYDKKILSEENLMKVAGGASNDLPVINYDDVKDQLTDPYSFTKGTKGGNNNKNTNKK